MSFFNLSLHAQIISSLFMTGLIWTIQVVHYPSFKFIDVTKFSNFEHFHSNRISYVVIPFMLLELVSAFTLIKFNTTAGFTKPLYFNLFILIVIWSLTFFISSRIHVQLLDGFDHSLIEKLTSTNWPRTSLWSAKSILIYWVFVNHLPKTV